jgi:serine/threonine protein kinase
VALKALRIDGDRHQREGFPATALREIRALRRLRHPNIVRLLEVLADSAHGTVLAFEYVEHDLAELIDHAHATHGHSPFRVPEAKCLAIQLLRALEYLHTSWLVHRDVKCSNLLYSGCGVLKLADFGLARIVGRRRATPAVVTLWYRSPELLLGEDAYGTAIDMWSAGCVIAELLTGTSLLPGRTEADQLSLIAGLIGSPSVRIWPGVVCLPMAQRGMLGEGGVAVQPYNFVQ